MRIYYSLLLSAAVCELCFGQNVTKGFQAFQEKQKTIRRQEDLFIEEFSGQTRALPYRLVENTGSCSTTQNLKLSDLGVSPVGPDDSFQQDPFLTTQRT